jgi:hypothetical protein
LVSKTNNIEPDMEKLNKNANSDAIVTPRMMVDECVEDL